MENPTILKPIDAKLVMSAATNVIYGSGIKTFQVNPNPVTDVLTTQSDKQTSGAKYITNNAAADFTVGNYPYITDVSATVWTAIGSTTGLAQNINLIGVDQSNNEVTETVVLNGTTPVATTYKYKCIVDIRMATGGAFAGGASCYVIPSGGSPDLRVFLSATGKANPCFMVGANDGVNRVARLRAVNSVYNTTAATTLSLHVFNNNTVQPGGNKGVHTPTVRLYELPVNGTQGILFPDDGALELKMGEMAVWYRDGASTVNTYISATWSFHNV